MSKLYFSLILTTLCLSGIQPSQAVKSPLTQEETKESPSKWVPCAPIKRNDTRSFTYWKSKVEANPTKYRLEGNTVWKKK